MANRIFTILFMLYLLVSAVTVGALVASQDGPLPWRLLFLNLILLVATLASAFGAVVLRNPRTFFARSRIRMAGAGQRSTDRTVSKRALP